VLQVANRAMGGVLTPVLAYEPPRCIAKQSPMQRINAMQIYLYLGVGAIYDRQVSQGMTEPVPLSILPWFENQMQRPERRVMLDA
jgi:hypothetical protein